MLVGQFSYIVTLVLVMKIYIHNYTSHDNVYYTCKNFTLCCFHIHCPSQFTWWVISEINDTIATLAQVFSTLRSWLNFRKIKRSVVSGIQHKSSITRSSHLLN